MEKNFISILLICILFFPKGHSQNQEEKIKELDMKLSVLEDYIRVRLDRFIKELKNKEQEIAKLKKSNKRLKSEVISLKKAIKSIKESLLRIEVDVKGAKEVVVTKTVSENEDQDPEFVSHQTFSNKKINKLAKSFSSPEPRIRLNALLKLSKMKDKEAISAVVLALKDKDFYVKILAAKILGRKKAFSAANSIMLLLSDNSKVVRQQGHKSLLKICGGSVKYNANASPEERAQGIKRWKARLASLQEKKSQ